MFYNIFIFMYVSSYVSLAFGFVSKENVSPTLIAISSFLLVVLFAAQWKSINYKL